MKNVSLFCFVTAIIHSCNCQVSDSNFLDHDTILVDLKTNAKESKYYENLNYDGILYLSSDSSPILDKIKPKATYLVKPERTPKTIEEFTVNLKNITDFFEGEILFKKITFSISKEPKYNIGDIYIKQPNKAFYTISGTDHYGFFWLDSYGILLEKRLLKLQYEYKSVE